ncbi:hypothetical protein T492DRAFT_860142 [Pavlovales sp. CCMP2436]|nr:hypothetical protein T492DRAFT_860142 [Pavlovales sp. CCMP2436]
MLTVVASRAVRHVQLLPSPEEARGVSERLFVLLQTSTPTMAEAARQCAPPVVPNRGGGSAKDDKGVCEVSISTMDFLILTMEGLRVLHPPLDRRARGLRDSLVLALPTSCDALDLDELLKRLKCEGATLFEEDGKCGWRDDVILAKAVLEQVEGKSLLLTGAELSHAVSKRLSSLMHDKNCGVAKPCGTPPPAFDISMAEAVGFGPRVLSVMGVMVGIGLARQLVSPTRERHGVEPRARAITADTQFGWIERSDTTKPAAAVGTSASGAAPGLRPRLPQSSVGSTDAAAGSSKTHGIPSFFGQQKVRLKLAGDVSSSAVAAATGAAAKKGGGRAAAARLPPAAATKRPPPTDDHSVSYSPFANSQKPNAEAPPPLLQARRKRRTSSAGLQQHSSAPPEGHAQGALAQPQEGALDPAFQAKEGHAQSALAQPQEGADDDEDEPQLSSQHSGGINRELKSFWELLNLPSAAGNRLGDQDAFRVLLDACGDTGEQLAVELVLSLNKSVTTSSPSPSRLRRPPAPLIEAPSVVAAPVVHDSPASRRPPPCEGRAFQGVISPGGGCPLRFSFLQLSPLHSRGAPPTARGSAHVETSTDGSNELPSFFLSQLCVNDDGGGSVRTSPPPPIQHELPHSLLPQPRVEDEGSVRSTDAPPTVVEPSPPDFASPSPVPYAIGIPIFSPDRPMKGGVRRHARGGKGRGLFGIGGGGSASEVGIQKPPKLRAGSARAARAEHTARAAHASTQPASEGEASVPLSEVLVGASINAGSAKREFGLTAADLLPLAFVRTAGRTKGQNKMYQLEEVIEIADAKCQFESRTL